MAGRSSSGRKETCLSRNVRRHGHILCVLARAKPKVVKQLVAEADPALLQAISECCRNVLSGEIPLTDLQKRRLAKYKTALRTLAAKKTSNGQRKALSQKGGLLPALLGVAAPLIAKFLLG